MYTIIFDQNLFQVNKLPTKTNMEGWDGIFTSCLTIGSSEAMCGAKMRSRKRMPSLVPFGTRQTQPTLGDLHS
jgi:hypothetical protein